MNKGILYGISAYTLWGILPVFWKLIQSVPAIEIIGHRMLWSFVFVLIVVALRNSWKGFRPVLHDRRIPLTFLATGLILGVNWLTYVWAVTSGFIVEASLGYFINPW